MNFSLDIPVEGLVHTLELGVERIEDLKPPLREMGAVLRKEAKEMIRTGQGLPPLAPATLARRLQTGTSRITKHGDLRASYAVAIDRQSKRLFGLEKWAKNRYFGIGKYALPDDVKVKLARHRAKLEKLNKQLVRAQEQGYQERKTGKSVAKRRGTTRLGQRFAASISTKVLVHGASGTLIVYSKIKWSAVQNDGGAVGNGATVPACHFLVLRREHLDRFAHILVKHGLGVFT